MLSPPALILTNGRAKSSINVVLIMALSAPLQTSKDHGLLCSERLFKGIQPFETLVPGRKQELLPETL
jgi:hypothetical protein